MKVADHNSIVSMGVTQKSQMAYDSFAMFDNHSIASHFSTKDHNNNQSHLDQTMRVVTQEYNTIQTTENKFQFLG